MQEYPVHVIVAVIIVCMAMGSMDVSVGEWIQGFGRSWWYGGVE